MTSPSEQAEQDQQAEQAALARPSAAGEHGPSDPRAAAVMGERRRLTDLAYRMPGSPADGRARPSGSPSWSARSTAGPGRRSGAATRPSR